MDPYFVMQEGADAIDYIEVSAMWFHAPGGFLTGLRYGVGIGVVSAETVLAGASDDLAEVMAEYSLPVIPVPEITASWRF